MTVTPLLTIALLRWRGQNLYFHQGGLLHWLEEGDDRERNGKGLQGRRQTGGHLILWRKKYTVCLGLTCGAQANQVGAQCWHWRPRNYLLDSLPNQNPHWDKNFSIVHSGKPRGRPDPARVDSVAHDQACRFFPCVCPLSSLAGSLLDVQVVSGSYGMIRFLVQVQWERSCLTLQLACS